MSRWKHVPGVDNPADDISRGLHPIDIIQCKRWWNGPDWLSLPPECWPNLIPTNEDTEAATEEMRKIPLVSMGVVQSDLHAMFACYSSFSKLRRVTAFCLRYLRTLQERAKLRLKDQEKYNQLTFRDQPIAPLNNGELQSAELELCRLAQHQSFAEELSDLASGEFVAKSSALKWLKPFIDQDGIIRVGGRLRNAALSDFVKHPIVLSAKHPLLILLASLFHLKLLHAGPQLLLATLRQKYWILGGRNLSKSVFHHCHTCFRSKPTLVQQSTADLPASRVSPTRPFSVCGIDYCGPFFKSSVRNRALTKAYVTIFVCFATKAVHIELVSTEPRNSPIAPSKVSKIELFLQAHQESLDPTAQSVEKKLKQLCLSSRLSADSSVLDYWEGLKCIEKELYQLAQTVLAVPCTQVTVERAFNILGLMLGCRRMNLTSENLAAILFVKLNSDLFENISLVFKDGN